MALSVRRSSVPAWMAAWKKATPARQSPDLQSRSPSSASSKHMDEPSLLLCISEGSKKGSEFDCLAFHFLRLHATKWVSSKTAAARLMHFQFVSRTLYSTHDSCIDARIHSYILYDMLYSLSAVPANRTRRGSSDAERCDFRGRPCAAASAASSSGSLIKGLAFGMRTERKTLPALFQSNSDALSVHTTNHQSSAWKRKGHLPEYRCWSDFPHWPIMKSWWCPTGAPKCPTV